jgi:hypothetical protein
MPRGLAQAPAIRALAEDLGIRHAGDAAAAIVAWCQSKVSQYMNEYGGCDTSDELLAICAQKTGTRFEVIDSPERLDAVTQEWVARGEKLFATLEQEFERGVLGVTFRLQHPRVWECPFLSVIDARGERKNRAWFTKWHELGHLLILGKNSKASFCRTHAAETMRDPEESLVDRIAGACAFHPDLVRPLASGVLTFDKLESIRQRLCPDASIQSSRLGIVQAWPRPCLLLECRRASKRGGAGDTEALRAVKVLMNDAARRAGTCVFPNMRVPERSVIYKAFGTDAILTAAENLNWWSSSSGRTLPYRHVQVHAQGRGEAVEALISA